MISPGQRLGLIARYRSGEGEWLDLPSAKLTAPADGRLVYSTGDPALKVTQTFNTSGNVLDWNIEIETITNSAIEVGDLAISLPMAGPSGEEPKAIFERGFLRHQFISGNGSFLYFVRASGVPPFLIVTVQPGTAFEYYAGGAGRGGGPIFIHSGLSGGKETRGTWRQQHTFLKLGRAGSKDSKAHYGLRFH